MRDSSHFPKADCNREEAIAEPDYWDEGFQAHLQVSPTSVASAHPDQAPILGTGQGLHFHSSGPPHDVLVDIPNVLMIENFSTNASAIANTTIAVTSSLALSTTSSALQRDSNELRGHPDSDIDHSTDPIIQTLPQPPQPDGFNSTIPPITLGSDVSTSHESEDYYDLDMSDDNYGGVPLYGMDDDIESNESIMELDSPDLAASIDSQDSDEEDLDSEEEEEEEMEGEEPTPVALPPLMPIGFQIFQMPPIMNNQDDMGPLIGLDQIPNQFLDDTPMISNPNPMMLGSENLCLFDFLRHWALRYRMSRFHGQGFHTYPLDISSIRQQAALEIKEVKYSDLQGDSCDMQGLDWYSMDTNRELARVWRCRDFANYTNKHGSDVKPPGALDTILPATDSFFRFRSLLVRKDVNLAHFQLRSVLACPSRTGAFYPSYRAINRINVDSKETEMAVDLRSIHGLGSVISTLDANHGVLMAGMFNGEYCLKNLDSEDKRHYASGRITNNPKAITNHLQIYLPRRSSMPVAALVNNDNGFRVLDLATEKLVSEKMINYSPNCSAISPDGRLRAIVGDKLEVTIYDADTGHMIHELAGHRDYGFSCDWSDDGRTLATGNQDKTVKIWDARKWCDSQGVCQPLKTIQSNMAGVRKLRFSPAGSGPRVLVAAEEADFINIIDAQTFDSQQTIDIFGEICGIDFTNEGQDLNILCSDHGRGGLLQLERLGSGPEPFIRGSDWRRNSAGSRYGNEPYRRKPAMLDELCIF